MAIGAHELLLIVRAQNQASALLSRVGRDFRRLQNMRQLDTQRARIVNQMAANSLRQQQLFMKYQATMAKTGRVRLQHEQAIARVEAHQVNIQNRIANLDIRRAAIARAESNVEVQRIRLLQQELGIEAKLEKIEARRAAIVDRVGRLGTTQLRNQQQMDQLGRRAHELETQKIQREMQLRKATAARMRGVSMRVSGPGMKNLIDAQTIAQRRLRETQMMQGELPGHRRILESVGADIRNDVARTTGQLKGLKIEEREAALAAEALAERTRGLEHTLAGLRARAAAVTHADAELNAMLDLTAKDLDIVNAKWGEQVAAMYAVREQIKMTEAQYEMLNVQLAETDALMAAQRGERFQTLARATSHFGRVLTAAGLIGVAAFGAMGIAAAKFNTQAVNVATQTGNINQSAEAVVRNAEKIQTVILKTMQTIPASSQELTDSLYNIYSSMQVSFGGGAKLLKLFGQVWVAGGMRGSIEGVSNALITLANNWGIAGDDMAGFKNLAASTLATVRFGRLTVEQYTETMNQLAPAFHGAHQSIEQMNGALAFLSRLLPSTGVTAAGIARMMEQLQRFAAAPKSGFEDLAKEIQDSSGNLLPLDQVLQIIINRMPELAKSGVTLTNFFKTVSGNQGTIQARRALQGFILQFPEYRRILKATSGDQKEFQRSLKAMQDSPGVKWATFMSQMHALALELGASVIPMLLEATKPLKSLAHWFDSLSDEQKKSYGHWLAMGAIVTLVGGVVLAVAGSIAAFILSLRTMGEALGILEKANPGAALRLVGSEAGFANTRLVRVLGTFGLLVALFPVFIKLTGSVTGAINLLSVAVTVLFLRKMVTSIMVVGTLRGAMIGLRAATLGEVFAILYLSYELSKWIRKIPYWDDIFKHFGETIYNAFHRTKDPMEVTISNLQKIRDEINHPPHKNRWWEITKDVLIPGHAGRGSPGPAPLNLSTAVIRKDIKDITDLVNLAMVNERGMAGPPLPAALIVSRLESMFPELTPEAIKIFVENAMRNFDKSVTDTARTGFADREGIPTGRALRSLATQFDMGQYIAALRQAYHLQQAMKKTTNPEDAVKAWIAYDKFVSKITENMTKQQKKMWQEILGMFDQFGTEGATHTQAQITKMVGEVNRLTKIFNKHPSIALSARIHKLQADIVKAQFGDQQSIAEDYYSARDALEKDSTKTVASEAKKRKKLIDDEFKKELKRQQDAQSTMKSATSNMMQIAQTAFQQYQSQIGTIFQGPWMTGSIMGRRQQFGFSARPEDLLKDMRMSVQATEKFNRTVDRVGKRGAPAEMVDQIRQLGPEAQKQVDTLLAQGPSMFAKTVKWFKRGQADAHAFAMRQLNAELTKWRKHGRAVALAIAAGLRDEDVALQMALRKMIAKMFPGTHMLATTRPTRAGAAAVVDSRRGTPHRGNYVVHDNRVTYNIHPSNKGENLQSMLRRTHFFYRNRK